jgi:DNA-binding transcriptional MocR family regulator
MIEFQRLDVSPEVVPTYCAYADYANNKTGKCYPSQETLARTLRCSVKTIQRHTKELVQKGLIEIVERKRIKGRFSTYVYKVVHIAQLATSGHGSRLERKRRNPRKSKKNRRNKRKGTKQDFNTPSISPPSNPDDYYAWRKQQRQREEEKRKDGYEFLFDHEPNPELLRKWQERAAQDDQNPFDPFEDLDK